MDRVLASEAKGRGFDSRRARHFLDSRKFLCAIFGANEVMPAQKRSFVSLSFKGSKRHIADLGGIGRVD